MTKRRPDTRNLENKARQMADRLDRMRGWIDEVQLNAAPKARTFYSSELISAEHLRALRDILGELQGFDEIIEPTAQPPIDDDGWEDEAD